MRMMMVGRRGSTGDGERVLAQGGGAGPGMGMRKRMMRREEERLKLRRLRRENDRRG